MNKLSSDGYVKTSQSYQESLSDEEIKARLADYIQVSEEELPLLKLNTHIRYLKVIGKNKYQYRNGGFLKKNVPPTYIVLSTSPDNLGKTWSVQYNGNVIYRKKTPEELVSSAEEKMIIQCDEFIEKKNEQISKLQIKLKNCLLDNQKLSQQLPTSKVPIKKKKTTKNT